MKKIVVMIADDHPIVRKAMINSFRGHPHICFLGEANNGLELMALIENLIPDIAIIDLEMPKMNGYDTILKVHTEFPEIKTIAFSGFLDSVNQQRAIKMGAFATISKTESTSTIVNAFEKIIEGEKFHSKVTSLLGAGSATDNKYFLLTMREKQILDLIAEGKTSIQISERYNISKWTVDKHRSNIRAKLGINNFAEMIRYAIEQKKSERKK